MSAMRKYYLSKKRKAYDLLGNKCAKCGFDDWRALQVGHIEGKGHTTGFQTYKAVIKDPSKYQLLCANCNWIKRHEEKEWYPVLDPYGDPDSIPEPSKKLTSKEETWLDNLDLPKIFREAIVTDKHLFQCPKCHSDNISRKKQSILYNLYLLTNFSCEECGHKGWYKRPE